MLRVTSALCLAVVVGAGTGSSAMATGIGTITDVVNHAFHTPPGGAELPAKTEDTLVADEVLRTEADSALSVLFVDGSELSVEAGSELVLSDYVFDTQSASSTGVIELKQGLFHFDSNATADSGIALQTPIATIGIRGTEFLVTVADGVTIVDVVDGEVEVTPRNGGVAARCVGGQSALVSATDADAICGDYGSFSPAAGGPAAPPATVAAGEGRGPSFGRSKEPATRDRPASGPDKDPPDKDPPASGGGGNHSGHGDGSNPGKGGGKGHDQDNGGSDNPGGSKN
jgi:hypothetical protein